ncbi:hypothetical protein CEXT_324951 [Caerostris extrusa]|uniref:Uncharacterized protein n=1 Tax=Caerostris extrusa TaxID=172846 RepID=A0AAV4RZL8_CAEEX|nr:hypothetical protein CEXT_324951 [Caerostris extrusa]
MDPDSTESGNVISFSTQKVLKNDILNSNDDSLNAIVSTYKEEDALADIIQSSHIDMAQFNTVSTYPSANKQDISHNAGSSSYLLVVIRLK